MGPSGRKLFFPETRIDRCRTSNSVYASDSGKRPESCQRGFCGSTSPNFGTKIILAGKINQTALEIIHTLVYNPSEETGDWWRLGYASAFRQVCRLLSRQHGQA